MTYYCMDIFLYFYLRQGDKKLSAREQDYEKNFHENLEGYGLPLCEESTKFGG